mmetsp:Transcript_89022/g.278843  ORF Transcript_89022/g.278843 Transcript_89022/m.278843 type:complete len:316 (+) Transcript_89022:1765-2712(+)
MHNEDLILHHGEEGQAPEDAFEHRVHLLPVLLQALLQETAAEVFGPLVDLPVLVVTPEEVHVPGKSELEGQDEDHDFHGLGPPVRDVPVEEVHAGLGRGPLGVEDVQHVQELAVRVAHDYQLLVGLPRTVQLELVHGPLAQPGLQGMLRVVDEPAEVPRRQRHARVLLEVVDELHCPIRSDDCLGGRLQSWPVIGGPRLWQVPRPRGSCPRLWGRWREAPTPQAAAELRGQLGEAGARRSAGVPRRVAVDVEQAAQLALHLRANVCLADRGRLVETLQASERLAQLLQTLLGDTLTRRRHRGICLRHTSSTRTAP